MFKIPSIAQVIRKLGQWFPVFLESSWGLREDASVKPRRTTAWAPLLVWTAWVGAAGCVASLEAEPLTGGKLVGGHQQLPVPKETGKEPVQLLLGNGLHRLAQVCWQPGPKRIVVDLCIAGLLSKTETSTSKKVCS